MPLPFALCHKLSSESEILNSEDSEEGKEKKEEKSVSFWYECLVFVTFTVRTEEQNVGTDKEWLEW